MLHQAALAISGQYTSACVSLMPNHSSIVVQAHRAAELHTQRQTL